jgi:hypothetical protein
MIMTDTKDEPIVQQLLDGTYIQEKTETKVYNVMEAKDTGIFLRYTDRASEGANEHYDDLKKKAATKASAFRHEWILNKLRAKGYKASDKKLLDVIRALYSIFWNDGETPAHRELINEHVEEIEYTEIKTFKLSLRLRSAVWESKLEKWSLDFNPQKPKDARKRQEKAKRAKALFAVWMAKHIKPVKDQVCTPKESEAYVKLLGEYVNTQIEAKHKAKAPQAKLEV